MLCMLHNVQLFDLAKRNVMENVHCSTQPPTMSERKDSIGFCQKRFHSCRNVSIELRRKMDIER